MNTLANPCPLPRGAWRVVVLVSWALSASACTYEFDKLATTPPVTDQGVADMATDMPVETDQGEVDMGPDMAVEEDMAVAPKPLVIGASCAQDAECGAGRCWQSFCTIDCDPGDASAQTCGDGAMCARIGDEGICVRACDALGACALPDGATSGLACVTRAVEIEGITSAGITRMCLPDGDNDAVADLDDRCLATEDPLQHDLDGDGIGDACDAAPRCHPNQQAGVVTYPSVDYAARQFGVPDMIFGDTLPVWGGLDDVGEVVATRVQLRRAGASWEALPASLYPTASQSLTPTPTGGFWISPGQLVGQTVITGRTLVSSPSGQRVIQTDNRLRDTAYSMTLGATRGGTLYAHTFDAESTNTGRIVHASSGALVLRFTPTGGNNRTQVYTTPGRRGRVIFYTGAVIDTVPDTLNQGIITLLEVDDANAVTVNTTLQAPKRADDSFIEPFIIVSPSGNLVMFDRQTGQAWRALFTDAGVAQLERAAGLDVTIPLALTELRWVALGHGTGFVMVGRPTDDPAKLAAVEVNLACLPDIALVDRDMDGVPDVEDLCPNNADAMQLDADHDLVGDVCDEDADDDGIPNAADRITLADGTEVDTSLDSDNDGTPNSGDGDADNDGVPDTRDRLWPDTNNNGIPNALDGDADSDGTASAAEGLAERFDQLVFPGAGSVAFVQAGATRTIKVGALHDLANAQAITAPAATSPHWPQLTPNGEAVLALAAAPDAGSNVLFAQRLGLPDGELPAFAPTDLGVSIRSAAPGNYNTISNKFDTLLIVHPSETNAARWIISIFDMNDPVNLVSRPFILEYPLLASATTWGSRVAFTGAPSDCEPCLSAYLADVRSAGNASSLVSPLGDASTGVTRVEQHGGQVVSVLPDPADPTRTIAVAGNAWLRPPTGGNVNSAAPIGSSPHVIASAEDEQGRYALWFVNGITQSWTKVLSSPDPLVEVDWSR